MAQQEQHLTTKPWVPELPTETFGQRLRFTRLVLGMSVTEMADSIGVPEPTLGTWEKGVTPRNISDVVQRMYEVHGVSAHWLMWGAVTLGKPESLTLVQGGSRRGDSGQRTLSLHLTPLR